MGGIVVTNQGWRNNGMPRLEGENVDVFPGSPLAVIGLWVFALRQRFTPDESFPMPWIWTDDLQPEIGEDGEPLPDGVPRKILIESAYLIEKSERNYRPAIYVGRFGGSLNAEKLSVDNKVGVRFPDQYKAYHCHGVMPVVFECESSSSGESSTIGETAWAFVLTCRDIFRKDFGFHEITEPVLSDTVQDEKDKEVWITRVSFSVTFDIRWGVVPVAPRLRDMALRMGLRTNPDYFTTIALRDGNDT